jgi:SAM-dependent methyltransferase
VRAELPSLLPLVCPACRVRSTRGREMHTVSVSTVLRHASDGSLDSAILTCDNGSCRRRYPILGGVPILVGDAATHTARFGVSLVEGELAPELQALLAEPGPDDAPYAQTVEHLSIYLDTHWGDRAAPSPDGPTAPFGMEALAHKLAERATAKVARAVELGCGVGRGVRELARGAELAVGIDLAPAPLRRARHILAGATLPYARRIAGRHYETATIAAAPAVANAALVCGDALDPPLAPSSFGRVAALNLLDALPSPPQLLSVVDGLCAPGGELILATPYAWQSAIVADAERLGRHDPAAELRRRLSEGDGLEARYAIEDEDELAWSLRRDARSATVYRVHWLRARKAG